MSIVGLVLGILLIVLGILYGMQGLTGKGVQVKTADNASAEEKARKLLQKKRIYLIAGIIGIIAGVIGIVASTVWTS
ncbi:MAG: hypothetical protein A2Z15_05645 [Chloroflexi bacterium RBG_16_50_11]|nr:MAG: hypothetical protein A2Z15_05645 [Chloroflexi bacterium RBG_16_50_11]